MELSSKTGKQFVFVDTYRCFCDMSIVIWIFYMGEDCLFFVRLFVFFFFYVIAKKAKLSTNKGAG